jgi:hypothetical protein
MIFSTQDAALMVQHLQNDYFIRTGYMNLRCHQDPGYPDHIHPVKGIKIDGILNIPENAVLVLRANSYSPKLLLRKFCHSHAAASLQ